MSRSVAATRLNPLRRSASLAIVISLAIFGSRHGNAQSPPQSFHTTVAPEPGEDIAKPCEYDLTIFPGTKTIRALFVVFERGPELQHFYEQPDLSAFAIKHDLAMLMPHHCARKDHEELAIDPRHGLGRALLTAVDQLSVRASHPELKTAPLIVMGFSGAGALAARLAGFAPGRIAATILSHAGEDPPWGLETVDLSAPALKLPELILVGGKDKIVGTEVPYTYFSKYWIKGAPWLFATQNDAAHFTNLDATDLILAWLDAILQGRQQHPASNLIDRTHGYEAYDRKRLDGSLDGSNHPLAAAVDLSFQRPGEEPPQGKVPVGWLPSEQVALVWQKFATLPDHHGSANQ